MYSNEKYGIHPFLLVFLDGIEREDTDVAEKNFLCHMIFPPAHTNDVRITNA